MRAEAGAGDAVGAARTGVWGVVSRAAFLACSWTWVIGMYLPVILMREFGWPGWVAFAVPNVVGAAGMGLVLRRRGASGEMLEGHRVAASAFSATTIAFQAFFVTWVCGFTFDVYAGRYAGVVCVGTMALFSLGLARLKSGGWGVAAVITWLLSIGMLVMARRTGAGQFVLPEVSGRSSPTELLYLAPVCVFGFALCPYLDLTFHRVRRETAGRAGDVAFVLGFGVLFLVMIVATLLYAQGIITNDWWSYYLVAHMTLQAGFTVGAHARERASLRRGGRGAGVIHAALTPLLVGVALGLIPGVLLRPRYGGGEIVYVVFMAMYGLVFPAYVWLVMGKRRRRALTWWALAVGIASPMFWMGFVEKEWVWLAPGLAVVLGAKLPLLRGGARAA
ncbi:MAG: hypothetical protein AB7G17_12825 [Phycisphaerales bacterium]